MPKTDSLQGSLDLLVLKILSRRPKLHGYAIMTAINPTDFSNAAFEPGTHSSFLNFIGPEPT